MYLGLSESSKGFKFFNPQTRKTFESRNVIWFDFTPFYARVQESTPRGPTPHEKGPFEVVPELEESFHLPDASKPCPGPQNGQGTTHVASPAEGVAEPRDSDPKVREASRASTSTTTEPRRSRRV